MCQYFGGKIRLGKEISKVINEKEISLLGHNNNTYFEPFLGMAGVFRHVIQNSERESIGCDAHEDLMLMWISVKSGWFPPREVTRSLHKKMKTEDPSALRGFVGFGCSYMGKFYSGFTETCVKSYNQVMSVSKIIRTRKVVFLKHRDYTIHDPRNMTIYCDPPYKESKISNDESMCFRGFDHDQFWDTMRKWSLHNLVFISETSAPDDFSCIWEKPVSRGFYKDTSFRRMERVFCHESLCETPH